MIRSVHTADYDRLRDLLRSMRKEAKLSQRALAERLDVSHSWVAKIETGERRLDLIEFAWYCEACGKDAREQFLKLMQSRTGRSVRAR